MIDRERTPRTPGGLMGWRYEAERRLAPHVEESWAETFVIELRLRDAPGRVIGDALAEVESHCAESGETAAEAFGEPVAYARSLALAAEPAPDPLPMGGALRWALQAVGLLVTTVGTTAWQAGDPLELTTGLVALTVVVGASILAVSRAADRALRFVIAHPVMAWAVTVVHLAVLVGLLLLLDDVLVRVPAGPASAVGIALLVGGTVAVLRDLHGTDLAEDPVTATLDESTAQGPARTRRASTWLRYAPALLAPVAAVVFVACWTGR